MFTKRGKFLVSIFLGIILFLALDHYRIHGILYQISDFKSGIENLIKSHEGLILLSTIITIGIVLDDYNRSKKKKR